MSSSSVSTVARIVYLTTDVLVDSLPPPPSTSVFTDTYHALSKTSIHKPKVISSQFGADPGSTILRNAGSLISFTATANSQVLTRLVLHLGELSSLPVVLHIAIQDDLSDVLLLRSAVPFFLLSRTVQQAHDNALLAARLARTERKAVVHAFYLSTSLESIGEVPEIKSFLFSSHRRSIASMVSVVIQ